jgi:hypothetical protein
VGGCTAKGQAFLNEEGEYAYVHDLIDDY